MGGEHDQHGSNQSATLATHLSHSGLLPSHVYFGSCFFVLGTWWFIAILRARYRLDRRTEVALTYPGKCNSCSRKLIEGLVKLVACIVGVVVEAITVKTLGRPANYTYDTIYASFMLAAVVDIFGGLRIVLPEGIDFLAHAVAFANLGILARSQAWGHLHLTVATRMLTSYVAISVTLALVLELHRPHSQMLQFIRTGAVMLQGVWFWQAGVVLDSPFAGRWVEDDHGNLMFITIAFAWDMCGVVLFQTFFAVTVEKLFGGQGLKAPRHHFRGNKQSGQNEPVNIEAVDGYKPLQTTEPLEIESSANVLLIVVRPLLLFRSFG
ncbi:Transmembrane protein 45B [Echinococcus granulosus]|uniref:Transmembrane protein 45B n=1 Tax=Echinococcus granulosus TaxID=6210 RepID=A0A068WHF4_ECHGR|nr:Transmembrane protein 45B [Echinococcus granulosus]CDS19177.1 Transmembrane protein 45B [Echinococcus granulosus]